ncbi:hypothetical protein [Glycomyces paridis]|uniref:Uncharacterized protein n=1 Tax=Glycomyces paridis TaxID=2126555 RepID=A0A4S8PKB4_9ACTN|nr:hypothetical protein [Glycomyces paridis]THV30012.1 hypothetical protein E9998_06405 [Glycomyces paridis]
MTATAPHPAWAPSKSRLLVTLYAGLLLTVAAGVAPLIDIATADSLFDHVRQAYPDWPADTVRQDRDAIAIYLAAVGALGLLCWLGAIWAVAAERRWARGTVTALFALGTLLALTSMTLGGEQYDTIVPPIYGALGLLPCLAGLAAVVLVWRRAR